MVAVQLAGKNRTRLVGIAAHGDDSVNRLRQKFLQMFRAMRGNINAHFGHDFDGKRMDITGGLRAGALDVGAVAERGAQKAFAEVAATGIAGAEDEDRGF
jgi:hypothetical protein